MMYSLDSSSLFDSGGDAALQQHGLARLAQFAQQVEVLHIARAYLKKVHIRQHGLNLRNLHDLADREQTVFLRGSYII